MMNTERQHEVIHVLEATGVDKPCPRCGNAKFELIGETRFPLNAYPGYSVVSTTDYLLPVIVIACSHCGYVTQHAQGPLGLVRPLQ